MYVLKNIQEVFFKVPFKNGNAGLQYAFMFNFQRCGQSPSKMPATIYILRTSVCLF